MSRVYVPTTLEQLWETLEKEPAALVFAGGTDLLVRLKGALRLPEALICLESIDEIKGVADHGDHVFIGAATTHTNLLHNPIVRTNFPVLTRALAVLGSPPIRNMGTIGGNIVNASPAGDTLPPLYALGAKIRIRSKTSQETLPIVDFIAGPGRVRLERGWIVTGIRVPKVPGFNVQHYEKVGRRKSQACSVAGLAAMLRLDEFGIIEAVRLAWGSVGPTVIVSPEIESVLEGRKLCREELERCIPLVENAVSPIDDVRATAEYRRIVSGRLLLRLV